MLKKIFAFLVAVSSFLIFIACENDGDMNEYSMKFQNINEFKDWLSLRGNKVTLKRLIIPNKEKDLFNLDRESGEFIINGEDNLCMLFESKKKWDFAPKFFEDLVKALSAKKKSEMKTYWNVRCFAVKK